MVTIKQLAKECDVSIATVSNVLNGTGRVSESTAKRILDTAKKSGYVPNMVAKNLKQKENKIIGIITEDLTVFNCAEIVDGINEFLDEKGYTFLLGNLRLFQKYTNRFYHHENYREEVEEEFYMMRAKQVEGIIYVGAHNREIHSIPEDLGIPVVMAYSSAIERGVPSVIMDDEQGAYDATRKLILLGHKEIGIVMGENSSINTKNRYQGYQRALYEHGILCNPSLVMEGDWGSDSGYEAGKKLLQKGVQAIFAMNDIMAAGVYDRAGELGLEIGKDLDLVGFDNREICTAFRPALTTMALPLHSIGRKSAEILVNQLNKNISRGKENQLLYKMQCNLVERKSTRRI